MPAAGAVDKIQRNEGICLRLNKNNRGSATVEITFLMVLYFLIVFMLFQGFFLLLSQTEKFCSEINSKQECSIEKTIKSERRWQFIDGAL